MTYVFSQVEWVFSVEIQGGGKGNIRVLSKTPKCDMLSLLLVSE